MFEGKRIEQFLNEEGATIIDFKLTSEVRRGIGVRETVMLLNHLGIYLAFCFLQIRHTFSSVIVPLLSIASPYHGPPLNLIFYKKIFIGHPKI